MSIKVESGAQTDLDRRFATLINVTVDKAIRQAFKEVGVDENGQFVQTIAKDTGDMRIGFRKGVAQMLRAKPIHRGQSSYDWETIKNNTISKVAYAEHHFRSRGFYKNPTTPGTYPMRLSRFKPALVRAIKKHIQDELKKHGIEHRARWSVT